MFLLKKDKAFKFNPITKESFKYLKKYFAINPIFYEANSVLSYISELDISSVIASGILLLRRTGMPGAVIIQISMRECDNRVL